MIRKIIIIFILILNISIYSEATNTVLENQQEQLNISGFIEEANKYSDEVFPDINIGEILDSAISGSIDNEKIYKGILNLLGSEIIDSIRVLGKILIIIIIHSVLKSISEGLENKSVAQIIYYAQYILIVTIVMSSFADILSMVNDTVQNLMAFMNSLIPILITLMLTTGSIVSASVIQPIILFSITLIGNIISNAIIPILLVSTVFSIISNISDKVQIDKLSKFFKSSIVWVLGIMLTVFVGILSIEGTLGSSVDGITAKTAKKAVSNVIPVVGKVLGDATDVVLGCAIILKNAVGIVGLIIILSICITPIIKLSLLSIIYNLMSAMCEPIADKPIVSLLEKIGDTFKILLGIVFAISTMLMIGITIVLKMSNSSMMYRWKEKVLDDCMA